MTVLNVSVIGYVLLVPTLYVTLSAITVSVPSSLTPTIRNVPLNVVGLLSASGLITTLSYSKFLSISSLYIVKPAAGSTFRFATGLGSSVDNKRIALICTYGFEFHPT